MRPLDHECGWPPAPIHVSLVDNVGKPSIPLMRLKPHSREEAGSKARGKGGSYKPRQRTIPLR